MHFFYNVLLSLSAVFSPSATVVLIATAAVRDRVMDAPYIARAA